MILTRREKRRALRRAKWRQMLMGFVYKHPSGHIVRAYEFNGCPPLSEHSTRRFREIILTTRHPLPNLPT